jgi:hypothetical protein
MELDWTDETKETEDTVDCWLLTQCMFGTKFWGAAVWCSKHDTIFQFFPSQFSHHFSLIFLLFLLYLIPLSHLFSYIHSDILRYYWRIRIYGKIHSRTQLTDLSPLNRIRKYQQINILWHLILNPYYSHQNTKPSKPHIVFLKYVGHPWTCFCPLKAKFHILMTGKWLRPL